MHKPVSASSAKPHSAVGEAALRPAIGAHLCAIAEVLMRRSEKGRYEALGDGDGCRSVWWSEFWCVVASHLS